MFHYRRSMIVRADDLPWASSLQRGCHNTCAASIVRNIARFDSESRTITLYARQLHASYTDTPRINCPAGPVRSRTRGWLRAPQSSANRRCPSIAERVALLFHQVSGRLGTTAKYHRYRSTPVPRGLSHQPVMREPYRGYTDIPGFPCAFICTDQCNKSK